MVMVEGTGVISWLHADYMLCSFYAQTRLLMHLQYRRRSIQATSRVRLRIRINGQDQGTIRKHTIRYDTIRLDTIRYKTIRYDTIRIDTRRLTKCLKRLSPFSSLACLSVSNMSKPGPSMRELHIDYSIACLLAGDSLSIKDKRIMKKIY